MDVLRISVTTYWAGTEAVLEAAGQQLQLEAEERRSAAAGEAWLQAAAGSVRSRSEPDERAELSRSRVGREFPGRPERGKDAPVLRPRSRLS